MREGKARETYLRTTDDPVLVKAQIENTHRMSDKLQLDFVRLHVPDEDSRVGRARDEDLVVVLEAKDGAFVAGEGTDDGSGDEVPDSNGLVALRERGRRQSCRRRCKDMRRRTNRSAHDPHLVKLDTVDAVPVPLEPVPARLSPLPPFLQRVTVPEESRPIKMLPDRFLLLFDAARSRVVGCARGRRRLRR